MSSISELYAKFRHLIHEGFKFLVIGAVGFVVTLSVANALHGIGKYKAITIATILATVITFLGNRYWTFRNRQGQGTTRESILFFVLNGVGLLIYYGCIGILELAGLTGRLWYNVAIVFGTGLGTLFRFWSYRKWVWHKPLETDAPEQQDDEHAQDLAGVMSAARVSYRPGSVSANGYRPGSASANGSSASSGSASQSNGASANGVSAGPHSHARPGRPSLWPPPPRGQEQGGRTPASHRRTQ